MKHRFSFGILYVDDEIMSLKYFEELFEDLAPIYIAESTDKALEIFKTHQDEIAIVLSDHQMPKQTGIEFLEQIRSINNKPLRLLITAFADLSEAVKSLNNGLLYSYLNKPWDPRELDEYLAHALDHYSLVDQRDRLLAEKSLAFQQLAMADKAASMGKVANGMNHNFRNVFNTVKTLMEITPSKVEEELGHPPADQAFWCDLVNEVKLEVDRATELLDQFTEATKHSNSAEVDQIDLITIFKDTANLSLDDRSDINFLLTNNVDSDKVFVSADQSRLSLLARLLLQESRNHMPDGGTIEIRISNNKKNDGFDIQFIDNNPTISKAQWTQIFDPHSSRSNNPYEFGINLAACRMIDISNGGNMSGKSLPDGRNAICFSIPVEAPSPNQENELTRKLLDGSFESRRS